MRYIIMYPHIESSVIIAPTEMIDVSPVHMDEL